MSRDRGDRAMAYIVTTRRASATRTVPPNHNDVLSRRAVATLEEAQALCVHIERESPRDSDSAVFWRGVIRDLPESGGTVGPLPDGTVIEVEQVEMASLVPEQLGIVEWTDDDVLDAFNARQS